MAIKYGDIILSDGEITFENGDIVTGNAKEQHIAAIVEAMAGNFRRNPTLAANLSNQLDGVVNSTAISIKVVKAAALDGWEIDEMDIDQEGEDVEISIVSASKTTDNTQSLV